MKIELKKYEIWLGYYHLGQGYSPPTKPKKVGQEKASTFEVACLKHELRNKLYWLERQDGEEPILGQDMIWWYDPKTNSNSWTGPYYQSEEEALKSFH